MTVKQATDLLWVLCSFESFDLLHTGRRMSVDAAADLLADHRGTDALPLTAADCP